MTRECTAAQLEFHGLGRRVLVGKFAGGTISSDSNGLSLREVEQRTHILKRLAGFLWITGISLRSNTRWSR